jgi:hypothetical protein
MPSYTRISGVVDTREWITCIKYHLIINGLYLDFLRLLIKYGAPVIAIFAKRLNK